MRLLLLFLLLPQLALADCRETADTNPSCIDTDKLYLRLGMGLGHRSNPVAGGRNLPYWLMPDLSYYSKHWFFDNSTLGYSFELTPAWQLSMVTRLNEEKGYFQRAHASNLLNRFMVSNAEIVGPTLRNQQLQQLSIKDVKKRPTALDAGLQLDWFLPQLQLRANWWHDVSAKYQGQHASLTLQKGWQQGRSYWQFSSALYWKSAELMQTYYGVDEVGYEMSYYRPSDSWQPELKLMVSYPLSKQWVGFMFYRYRWLDNAMTDSPLVQENNIRGWFIGLSYQFF